MYAFTYHKPASLDDVKAAFAGCDEPQLLAGGMTLLPTLKLRLNQPSDLIDLSGVGGLDQIRRDGDTLVIGAMTRHAQVAASATVQTAIPALATLAGHIGDPQVRNRGTLGGSIANNDPAADYPAALLALNATVVTSERTVSADDFFVGLFETALDDGEIVLEVRFPVPQKAAYEKFPNPASRYALVGVMAVLHADGARVAVTGAAQDGVFRVTEMEQALTADFCVDAIKDCGIGIDIDELNDDIHADSEYRAHLVKVIAQRAVAVAAVAE